MRLLQQTKAALKDGCLMFDPSDVKALVKALDLATAALAKLSVATDETPVKRIAKNTIHELTTILK